jgi:hypothetical protein
MLSISLDSLFTMVLFIIGNYCAEISIDGKPVSKTKITISLIAMELVAIVINSLIATYA